MKARSLNVSIPNAEPQHPLQEETGLLQYQNFKLDTDTKIILDKQ